MNEIKIGKSQGASQYGWHRLVHYLECPKKYQFSEVRKVRIPTDVTPAPFAIGLLHHAMRARWFANRFATSPESWQSIREAAATAATENGQPIAVEDEQAAMDLFQTYVEHWKNQPHPEPVACEYLLGPAKLDANDFDDEIFTARLDDVSWYNVGGQRLLCIGESKTCSDTKTTLDEYELHGQPLLQAALWKVSPQGEALHGPIAGIMLDVVRKPYNKGKVKAAFTRQFIPIKPRVMDWYMRSIRANRTSANSINWNTEVLRNVTSCTRMYGRMRIACPYRDLCANGKTAASQYVYGPEGKDLRDWRPTEEEPTPPWE